MTSGLAMAAYYGDGVLDADDLAAGLTGAIVKDPVQDQVVWLEYLQTVVKERDGWKDLYRACQRGALSVADVRRMSSASAITAPAARAACARRSKRCEPDVVLVEGPPDAAGCPAAAHAAPRCEPPVALLIYAPDEPRRRRLLSLHRSSRPSGRRCATPSSAASRPASWTCRRPSSSPRAKRAGEPTPRVRRSTIAARRAAGRRARQQSRCAPQAPPGAARRRAADARRSAWPCWPRPPATSDHELWWEHQVEQRQRRDRTSSPASSKR